MDLLLQKKGIIGAFALLSLITICSLILAYRFYSKEPPACENNSLSLNDEINDSENQASEQNESQEKIWFVEVKGAVKKPGVYEVRENNIINDVITLAGGFTKVAYTNNINLSKKVKDELVINVFTKSEYKKNTKPLTTNECTTSDHTIDNCTNEFSSVIVTDNNNVNNQETSNNENSNQKELININTASINDLTKLTGIGEGKAKAIIEYREANGGFKQIEDIKNVSGIGDATYEKFKDNITV